MNDSNIVEKMSEERELLHKELALLAEKSQCCEPSLLADYAIAMCAIYDALVLENCKIQYSVTHIHNSCVSKSDALELVATIEKLFEPFAEIIPNFDELNTKINALKETL